LSVKKDGNVYKVYVVSDYLDTSTGILSIGIQDFKGNSRWSDRKGVLIRHGSRPVYKF